MGAIAGDGRCPEVNEPERQKPLAPLFSVCPSTPSPVASPGPSMVSQVTVVPLDPSDTLWGGY